MRITLVSETYLPQLNGVSRTLGQLVATLQRAGDTVQLVHPDYGEKAFGPHDVRVRSEQPPFYGELRLPLPPFDRVHESIAQFSPDVIHIATEFTLGLSVLRFAVRNRLRVVSSFHTNFDQYAEHYGIGWVNGLVWRYLRWFHNSTLETYVPSRATIATLQTRGFERLVRWPRGVDCDYFSPARAGRARVRAALGFTNDQVVVGHVGRIAAEKNLDFLTTVLLKASDVLGSRMGVLIVGDGPARADVENRLGPRAHCVGYKTGAELADHYAACDVFVFASVTETFGNVILEAMASGLPVIAMRAGGPAEIVADGKTGILIEPSSDAGQMAAAVERLVNDAPLRATMSAAARSYAQTQSWDFIMRGLRARYEQIVQERPQTMPNS